MIRKTLLAAALSLGLIASPALALSQFYEYRVGQWSIEGYYGDKNFCSAKTYWNNGSYVSLFNMQGSDIFSLYVHNEDWNITGDFGSYYSGRIEFSGNAGFDAGDMDFELKDPQTIVIRNLTNQFIQNWIMYRNMNIVMPNDIPDLFIGLSGTSDAADVFADCIVHLNQ